MEKQLIAPTVAVCSANIAYAKPSGFYVGGQSGRSLLKTETITTRNGDFQNASLFHKARSAVSVIAGYNFNQEYDIPIRTDLSFTFRDNKEIKTRPELGKRIKISAHRTKFAYSMGLSVCYRISEHWSADIMTKNTFTEK